MLETLTIILVLAILGISSYTDIRTGEVSNRVWLVGAGTGLIIRAFTYSPKWFMSVAFVIVLSYVIWRFTTLGGADIKCLLFLGIPLLLDDIFVILLFGFLLSLVYVYYMKNVKNIKVGNFPFLPFLFFGYIILIFFS